jgi:hypothetical protein
MTHEGTCYNQSMYPDDEYRQSLPREAQRLLASLERHVVKPEIALQRLDRVIDKPYFDQRLCKETLSKLFYCNHLHVRETGLRTLLSSQAPLPSPNFLANLVINSSRYELVPLMVEHNHLPEKLSDNLQDGVMLALPNQWSYPDVLCPNLFMIEGRVSTMATSLFTPEGRLLNCNLLAKTLSLPMCESAAGMFTLKLLAVGSGGKGHNRLAKVLAHENGQVCGLLMQAGLIHEDEILTQMKDSAEVHNAFALGRAWCLQQETTPTSTTRNRIRL